MVSQSRPIGIFAAHMLLRSVHDRDPPGLYFHSITVLAISLIKNISGFETPPYFHRLIPPRYYCKMLRCVHTGDIDTHAQ
jgi:hypothetical protein